MKRILAALVAAFVIAAPVFATGFDFRTVGTTSGTYFDFRQAPSLPAVSQAGRSLIVMDPACGCLKLSENGGAWVTLWSPGGGGGGVTSIFGRTGTVIAVAGDYNATQVNATPFGPITGTTVQTQLSQLNSKIDAQGGVTSWKTRTGAVTPASGDYTASQVTSTAHGDVAATQVQAAIDELADEKVNSATVSSISGAKTFTASPSTPITTKPSPAPPANTKQIDVQDAGGITKASIDYEGDAVVHDLNLTGTVTSNVGVGVTALTPLHVKGTGFTLSTWPGEGNAQGIARIQNATDGIDIGVATTNSYPFFAPIGTNKHILFGHWNGSAYIEDMRIAAGALTVGGGSGGAGVSLFNAAGSQARASHINITGLGPQNNWIGFGQYYDGAWKPTSTSAFQLYHSGTNLILYGDAGLTANTAYTPTERMRIDSSGNVGIGASPTFKLDVQGTGLVTSRLKSTSGAVSQVVDRNATTDAASVNFRTSGTDNFILGTGVYSAGTEFQIGSAASKFFAIDTSGNVGVGATPNFPFDLKKDGVSATTWNVIGRFGSAATDRGVYLGDALAANTGVIAPVSSGASSLRFFTYTGSVWAEGMRIDSAQRVGIGRAPDAGLLNGALHVGGISGGTYAQLLIGSALDNYGSIWRRDISGSNFFSDIFISAHPSSNASVLRIFRGPSDASPAWLIATDGSFQGGLTGSKIYERGRATAMGEWITFTPTLGSNTGTWTGGTVSSARYQLVGKTMTVDVQIITSTITGTPGYLTITIPGGFTAAAGVYSNTFWYQNNGAAWSIGEIVTGSSGTAIQLYRDPSGTLNYAAGSSNNSITGQLTFEVQ